jgi:homopolymeric O-antigen transport system permease protein
MSAGTQETVLDDERSSGWVLSRPARALEVLQRIACFPALAHHYRDLVGTSLRRDLAARFQGTVLGWAWPVVQPLFLFGVYYFIFTQLLQQRMPDLPVEQRSAMGVYMFCGILVWGALGEALHRGTNVIVENGNLIKKLAFPSELLPLNVVLAGLTMMLFGIAVFVVGAVLTPIWPAPGWSLLWLPLLVFLQGTFTYGLVLFLSTLQVFLRDTLQVVGMAVTIWMFLTPVFWVPEAMNRSVLEHGLLIGANPAYHLVRAWRGALMGDVYLEPSEHIAGGYAVSSAAVPHHALVFAAWALGAYAVGHAFFVLSQRRFADEV